MKKKDKLEQFVLDHRDAFDDERPSFKVWADIENELKKKSQKPRIWIWSIAASLLLLAGIALGILASPQIYEYQQLQVLNKSEEFSGMQEYFSGEIEILLTQLKGDEQASSVSAELEAVDLEIDRLKLELIHAPKKSKEIILQAIIESYEAKVSLLETAINRKKEVKKLNNEVQHI